jgi:hypothetical protein
MINVGYVLNIYKNNIIHLKMNYNLIQMMKFNKKIQEMIFSIEKRYVKQEMVVLYVMINDGENQQE